MVKIPSPIRQIELVHPRVGIRSLNAYAVIGDRAARLVERVLVDAPYPVDGSVEVNRYLRRSEHLVAYGMRLGYTVYRYTTLRFLIVIPADPQTYL